jgi:hypothetical protein
MSANRKIEEKVAPAASYLTIRDYQPSSSGSASNSPRDLQNEVARLIMTPTRLMLVIKKS